jgi:hypothetical protein
MVLARSYKIQLATARLGITLSGVGMAGMWGTSQHAASQLPLFGTPSRAQTSMFEGWDFIAKPYGVQELAAEVRRILDS